MKPIVATVTFPNEPNPLYLLVDDDTGDIITRCNNGEAFFYANKTDAEDDTKELEADHAA